MLKDLKILTDEVVFHFVSEPKICEIHKDFFKDPSSTDCITFPIDPPHTEKKFFHHLGEAFICPKVALEYAGKHRISPQAELMRYIIHCLLHLIGYDDIQTEDRVRMKKKENSCLKKVQQAGLLENLIRM